MRFKHYLFSTVSKPFFVLGLIVLDAYSISVYAAPMQHLNESSLNVSRYVVASPGPTKAQHNPLQIVIPRVTFHNHINSVGQAITELLKNTGFSVARFHPDKRVEQMFQNQLPAIHRNMGPLTLEQALKTLIGKPWILSVDPVHRLVSYELPGSYRQTRKQRHQTKKVVQKPAARPVGYKKKTTPSKKYDWDDIEELFGDFD